VHRPTGERLMNRSESWSIFFTSGWVYYKKNIFTRAIVYFKEALELDPKFSGVEEAKATLQKIK
jgi:hypothetical protein